MTALRRALLALGVAVIATGLVMLLVILGSDFGVARGADAAFTLTIGWSFALTGLFAWWRRPANRTGALMVAVGYIWLFHGLQASSSPWVFTLGVFLNPLAYAPLVHLIVGFPDGRLTTRLQRWIVAGTWFDVTVLQFLAILFADYPTLDGCDGCPHNPLLLTANSDVYNAINFSQALIAIAAITGTVIVLRRRWRDTPRPQRAALAPVIWASGLFLVSLGISLSVEQAGPERTIIVAVYIVALVMLASVPFAFLAGLLRSRLSRAGAVSDLVARLGEGAGRRRSLRDALAEAFGDPTLQLAYWLPDRERYVDSEGRPVELPAVGGARSWTPVARDGEPLAAIVYDASLADERELLDAAGAAAALTLENERLDAEVRARVEELSRSRERLIEVGLAERRALERNLHDGAQQRLVALALSLRLARGKLDEDPGATAELLEEAMGELDEATAELRELARGIHPAVLSDRGLPAALEALAGRAPVVVEVLETPAEALPAPVEAAAYYVVAEALTNVAKYADAERAEVRVTRDNGRVLVQVTDDGVGGADPAGGSGLRGLADRLAALDGRLEVDSPRGAGTTIRAQIPCA
jgi:signal transduction histidine kinase